MNTKVFSLAALLFAIASTAVAAPILSIIPQGLQGGNWVWEVDVSPDIAAAGTQFKCSNCGHTSLYTRNDIIYQA